MGATQQCRNCVVRRHRVTRSEEVAEFPPGRHRGSREVEQPSAQLAGEGQGEKVCHDLVVASGFEDGLLVR